MKSPEEILRELENLLQRQGEINTEELFAILDQLENKNLKQNIIGKLVSRGIASSSRQAKSWRHLTARTAISTAIQELRDH